MCFVVLLSWELYRKGNAQHYEVISVRTCEDSCTSEREEIGSGKRGSQVKACKKVGREGALLLLSALVFIHANVEYAPAQGLLPEKNSGGTR